MKKLLIAVSLLFVFSSVSAQKQPLKGPQAKNYKPYFDTDRTSVALETVEGIKEVKLQGPEAKNAKIWKREPENTQLVTFTNRRSGLKGPKYKNFRFGR